LHCRPSYLRASNAHAWSSTRACFTKSLASALLAIQLDLRRLRCRLDLLDIFHWREVQAGDRVGPRPPFPDLQPPNRLAQPVGPGLDRRGGLPFPFGLQPVVAVEQGELPALLAVLPAVQSDVLEAPLRLPFRPGSR